MPATRIPTFRKKHPWDAALQSGNESRAQEDKKPPFIFVNLGERRRRTETRNAS